MNEIGKKIKDVRIAKESSPELLAEQAKVKKINKTATHLVAS